MICRFCKQDLPKSDFTSTQAKFCNQCRLIRKLKQRYEMTKRSLDRQKAKKPKKQVVQSLASLKKTAQRVFNKWIRQRDSGEMCISCGKRCGEPDAGHYIAQGSSGALRYNEDNCHVQGTGCNRYKHGNLLEYRYGLIAKIGEDRVKWLEAHRKDIKKWSREELEEIIKTYRTKLS